MITRFVHVLRTHGLRDSLRRAWRKLSPRGEPSWLVEVRAIDADFDHRHGVATGGVVDLTELTIAGDNRKHGVRHVAIPPDEFQAAFDALPAEASGAAFVDLGAGKGRALLLASRYPFRQFIGVEFAKELCALAQTNLARVSPPVSLLCMDAAEYEFPAGPLVVYLYNPFGAEIMRRVAQRAKAAIGPMWVMYLNPFEEMVWTECGFERIASGPTFAILARQKLD